MFEAPLNFNAEQEERELFGAASFATSTQRLTTAGHKFAISLAVLTSHEKRNIKGTFVFC